MSNAKANRQEEEEEEDRRTVITVRVTVALTAILQRVPRRNVHVGVRSTTLCM